MIVSVASMEKGTLVLVRPETVRMEEEESAERESTVPFMISTPSETDNSAMAVVN